MTVSQLAAEYGVTRYALYKRRKRGQPVEGASRRRTVDHYRPAPPDPLNALCNAWRTPDKLAALGVRRNLKARI